MHDTKNAYAQGDQSCRCYKKSELKERLQTEEIEKIVTELD